MRHLFPLVSAAVLALTMFSAGCSPRLGDDTGGEKGNLRFEYSSCLFGCSLEQNALQGSKVTISAKGVDSKAHLTARLSDAAIGTIVTQNQRCTDGADCILDMEIETTGAGDAKVDVIDADGALVDRVTIKVRPAARIELEVRDRQASDGVYAIRVGEKLKIASKVLDADGNPMIFAAHGVAQTYADPSIVGPDEYVLFGSSDVEDAIAKRVGDTSLAVRATGAENVVLFRVTR